MQIYCVVTWVSQSGYTVRAAYTTKEAAEMHAARIETAVEAGTDEFDCCGACVVSTELSGLSDVQIGRFGYSTKPATIWLMGEDSMGAAHRYSFSTTRWALRTLWLKLAWTFDRRDEKDSSDLAGRNEG